MGRSRLARSPGIGCRVRAEESVVKAQFRLGRLGMERISEAVLDRLYEPVGKIMVNWAVADLHVTHLAFAMFKHLGEPERARSWPRMFGARVDALEKLFKRSEFADFKADADRIIKDTRHHQKLRNMLDAEGDVCEVHNVGYGNWELQLHQPNPVRAPYGDTRASGL
jgi:hypothetical protein